MDVINEHDQEFRNGDHGPKYMFKGPKFEWGIIVVKAGDTMSGHYHEEVEETFYFVQGGGEMIVDGVPHSATEGDVFRLEPPERHNIRNTTDVPTRVVFIKTPYLPDDKVAME